VTKIARDEEWWLAKARAEEGAVGAGPDSQVVITTAIVGEIAQERMRQIEQEGWTPGHDDGNRRGQLARAAGCYALHAGGVVHETTVTDREAVHKVPMWWPWSWRWWKPTDPRRCLVKAGALVVAAIELLDREEGRHG
jgi:hypothetical protein